MFVHKRVIIFLFEMFDFLPTFYESNFLETKLENNEETKEERYGETK